LYGERYVKTVVAVVALVALVPKQTNPVMIGDTININWRRTVLERDNNKCQSCKEVAQIVHHIEPFAEIISNNNIKSLEDGMNCQALWLINNGISLCKKCHNNKQIRLLLAH
jgi:hypothetical protein